MVGHQRSAIGAGREPCSPRPRYCMAARLTTYVVVGIVAATLIAGLIVGAQRDDNDGPVDLIVFNGKVYTADASGSMAEAVAVRGNQILRVGSNREINRLRRPQTVVVDALGAAVLPGFNDADVQFIAGGLGLDTIDLLDAASRRMKCRRASGCGPRRTRIVRGWSAVDGTRRRSGPADRRGNCSMRPSPIGRPSFCRTTDARRG